jgi:hypothetical protein
MFDLDQSIAEWRKQMLAAGIKSPVPLEELEIHLLEEIERQMKSGLSATEAFQNATQQIGSAFIVHTEFQKVEVAKEARRWKTSQIWLWSGLGLASVALGGIMLFNSEMTSGQRLSGLAAIAVMDLLASFGWLGHSVFPVIQSRRIRERLGMWWGGLVIIWVGVLVYHILPRYDSTLGQYVVAFLWGFITPVGASIGLNMGIETAAHKKLVLADL